MTPSRPYVLRAMYDWILDNQLTPYIIINASYPEVKVPENFIENGEIVLNIDPEAIMDLRLGKKIVEFSASFSGTSFYIHLPIMSVKAIYASENGEGMVFSDDEEATYSDQLNEEKKPPAKGKPMLRVIKKDSDD